MKTIRVGFYVIYGSAFSAGPLIERMLQSLDVNFEVYLIASPDVMRGDENMNKQLDLVVNYFSRDKRINVRSAYDKDTHQFIDHSEGLDFACICNPYESMTHEYCSAEYLKGVGVKTFFIHYTFAVTKFDNKIYLQEHFENFWRVFISSLMTYSELTLLGKSDSNLIISGYPKIESLSSSFTFKKERKKIVLSPHHTFNFPELSLASFQKFQDLYLDIPCKYPNIDFVFRPHPLWEINLKNKLGWSEEQYSKWISKLLSNKNVNFDRSPDYIELFNQSDALIHDCGSFVAEYLCTGNPCCFLMNQSSAYENFNSIGKMCLDQHYHAHHFDDVYKFIDEVVIGGNDPLNESRMIVVDKFIRPHQESPAQIIINNLIHEFNVKYL